MVKTVDVGFGYNENCLLFVFKLIAPVFKQGSVKLFETEQTLLGRNNKSGLKTTAVPVSVPVKEALNAFRIGKLAEAVLPPL